MRVGANSKGVGKKVLRLLKVAVLLVLVGVFADMTSPRFGGACDHNDSEAWFVAALTGRTDEHGYMDAEGAFGGWRTDGLGVQRDYGRVFCVGLRGACRFMKYSQVIIKGC